MGLTTDRNDKCIYEIDPVTNQQKCYLVLPTGQRKLLLRPLRHTYKHVGRPGPRYSLLDLTPEQAWRYSSFNYVKYEAYPASESPIAGRYWTQAELDKIGKGCGGFTTMADSLAETYAANPDFYGGTYCATCRNHFPAGETGEFVWAGTDERVGT